MVGPYGGNMSQAEGRRRLSASLVARALPRAANPRVDFSEIARPALSPASILPHLSCPPSTGTRQSPPEGESKQPQKCLKLRKTCCDGGRMPQS